MAELQINLPDPISAFAGAQVASGRFPTIDNYLEALVSADEQVQTTVAALNENPEVAALLQESLDGGHGRGWSPSVLRELKQQVRERAAGNGT
jgi:Arc/MetJ-type ribon-helix-helix transcriptional regulator